MSLPRVLAAVVAVAQVEAAAPAFEELGFLPAARGIREEWGVEGWMFPLLEGGYLELVAPTGGGGAARDAVRRFLGERGEGLYMAAVEVADVGAEHRRLVAAGIPVLGPPVAAPPVNGWRCRLLWIPPRATGGFFLQLLSYDQPPRPAPRPAPYSLTGLRVGADEPAAALAALDRLGLRGAGIEVGPARARPGLAAAVLEGDRVDERTVEVHGARLEFRRGGSR